MFCGSLRRLACALFVFSYACAALLIQPEHVSRYANKTYDYIVVGGGTAGLVVANRLSEDPSVSVLVLEAGILDNSRDLKIPSGLLSVPGLIGSANWPSYRWNLTTAPQKYLANQSVQLSQGRAVRGSSILNGLCWTRGAAAEYDAWEALGNRGWGWKDMLPYFKNVPSEDFQADFSKSETFTPDRDREDDEHFRIAPELGVHGQSGPVQVSYPRYFYNQSANVLQAFSELGIPILTEPNNGVAAGAMMLPSSMTPNQTRSDAREAYFDPVIHRPNLHVATEQRVTRLVLDSTHDSSLARRVVGVEFATNENEKPRRISSSREVILSAGAIFSPTLLQVSGIGPPEVLESLGIPVEINLPGVGYNLQDHPLAHVDYYYSNSSVFKSTDIHGEIFNQVSEMYLENRTGPWTAPLVNMVGFPALRWVTPEWHQLLNKIDSQITSLPRDTPPSVQTGYSLQKSLIASLLSRHDTGAFEIMATSWGELGVATQKPLSRGTVRPSSKSMFDDPIIDPRYCSSLVDCEVMVLALQLNVKLIRTEAMRELRPVPEDGFNTTGADALIKKLIPKIGTEHHPCGTTAMMPRDLGGVVDSELREYGTSNLRVVDAGVIPMIPAAHLQAAVYAIAEKAADLVKSNSTEPPVYGPLHRGHSGHRWGFGHGIHGMHGN